jgi:membrane-bound lytic murein transglycosylase B
VTVQESTSPPVEPTAGRHAATRSRRTAPLGRRRWLVAGAVAALAALLAPPPGNGTATAAADTSAPKRLSPEEVLARLSVGAPSGSITLASTPVHVASAQPLAPTVITGLAANGIPNVALNAYRVAAARMDRSAPCGIDWSLLAGIGRVESNHGRFGGATLSSDGTSAPRIIGPALDGKQFAFIRDTDHGQWDGDPVQDRAVGPMQFIPATWRAYGVDGNGDGVADPFNINDAALAAAHYLCVAGGNLSTDAGQRQAVMAYNHSDAYVNEVLGLAHAYAAGIPVADIPLVGNTTSPVPAASGVGATYYNAPASPSPAIGASDHTPATPGSTVGATPAGTRKAASSGNSGGSSTGGAPAGGGGSTGSSGSGGGTTVPATGGTGSGGGAGAPAGSGGGGTGGGAPAPAPGPLPAPVPAPVPVPNPVPNPVPSLPAVKPPVAVPTTTPLPTCVPVPLVKTCPTPVPAKK